MDLVGYFLALIIGISLGLLGGGGSILTVPIFVYVFGFDPVLSTAYSLFVVGTSAAIGAIRYKLSGLVNMKVAVMFALPALVSVYITRAYILPIIPVDFEVFGMALTRRLLILGLFAVLMLLAARSMIKGRKENEDSSLDNNSALNKAWVRVSIVIAEGALVGFLTGLVGAGGGFLIVPVLVLLERMSIRNAIGTSLVIIAIKSLIGFTGDLQTGLQIDWTFLLLFSAISIVGILGGFAIGQRVNSAKLKKGFGYFVLVMAVVILFKELSL